MVSLKKTIAWMSVAAASCGTVWAASGPSTHWGKARPAAIDNTAYIGVNNLQMVVSNVGSFAYDPTNHFGKADGLYFPRGTTKSVVFASGLWIGARVHGTPRVTVAEYTSEYSPGGMADGTFIPDEGRFHVYKINRGDDAASNPDYASWPFDDGAPAVKAADGSDSLGADNQRIPLILGDEALFAVYNDANLGRHRNGAGSTPPLGLEVQQYTFAFGRSGALGNSIYMTFRIINKGTDTLQDTYLSLWSDPDVGDANNDLVGCDTALSLGYAYNDGPDNVFGDAPPAVGYDFLQGPKVPSPGDSVYQDGHYVHGYRRLPMCSFNKYENGTDPTNSVQTYNYMRGLSSTGDSVQDPGGVTTLFQVAGDPVTNEGWIDVNANDRRLMMNSGPFTMVPNDTQDVVVAVLVGQGADHLSSITALKSISERVQAVFDLDFRIPFPPPQPTVWYQPLRNKAQLIWGTEAQGDVQVSAALGQRFIMEGYNVYQGESRVGPWKKIATFDIDDDVTRIYKDMFNASAGGVDRELIEVGSNSGLTNHLLVSSDRINGGKLINNRPYYFGVTAYSYDTLNMEEYRVGGALVGVLTEVLETRIQPVEVVPNSIAMPLVDTALRVSGSSEGIVEIRYLDPSKATGDRYEITFNPDLSWNLMNLTSGLMVLSNQANQAGDFVYPEVDGFMVQTIGPPPGIKDVVWEGSAEAWVTGVNWGGSFLNGGLDKGANFWGSSLENDTDLVSIELRFSTTVKQRAYRYLRGGSPNYSYQDYPLVPLTAWDVSVTPARQVNLCFVEQYSLPSEDNTWLPPDDDRSTGGREYLFVLKSTYSETPNELYATRSIRDDAPDLDVQYAWWPTVADSHSSSELADGQILRIELNKYNRPDDRFEFTAMQAGQQATDAGLVTLKNIHPLPNPYYHMTDVEDEQNPRLIKFVNLPPTTATLEIYNLNGELIRTLTKDNPTSGEMAWDVLTQNGLPPASGIYIYRITIPGGGQKIGKVAVFTKAEQLRIY